EQAELLFAGLTLEGAAIAAHLKDPDLTKRNSSGDFAMEATPENFSTIYSVYRLLHKVSYLLHRLHVGTADVKWLLQHAAAIAVLELNKLPIAADAGTPQLSEWAALCQWLEFKAKFPEPGHTSLR